MMRKRLIGTVTSNRMQKTIVVVTSRLVLNPRFKKYVRQKTKHYVHDEKSVAKIGDRVQIEETRPLSKLKRWRLLRRME